MVVCWSFSLGSFPFFFFSHSHSLFHSLNPLLIPDSLSPQHCQFRHLRACAQHPKPLPKKFAAIYHLGFQVLSHGAPPGCFPHSRLFMCAHCGARRRLIPLPITSSPLLHSPPQSDRGKFYPTLADLSFTNKTSCVLGTSHRVL